MPTVDEIDANFVDVLARELWADKAVPSEMRLELMRGFVQASPGGLLALAWVCSNDKVDVDFLLEYAGALPFGEPEAGSLGDAECEAVVDGILRVGDLEPVSRVGVCVRLLASVFMSASGRNAALKRVLTINTFSNKEKKIVFQWAMGLNIMEDMADFKFEVPQAPVALARAGVNCLVDSGEDAARVIRHVVTNIMCWDDSRSVLGGLLDLLGRGNADLQGSLNTIRRQLLELCSSHSDASIRRRAYRMGTTLDNKDFLQKALKDSDFAVRMWAIGQLKG